MGEKSGEVETRSSRRYHIIRRRHLYIESIMPKHRQAGQNPEVVDKPILHQKNERRRRRRHPVLSRIGGRCESGKRLIKQREEFRNRLTLFPDT